MCSANMGKAGLQPRAPPLCRVQAPGLPTTPGPIWLSCWEGCSPVGSQIALHRLGPQQSWKPGNPSWASRWGRLQPWGGGQVTICRASPGGATGQEGPARLPAHTLGVRPWLAFSGRN